LPLGLKGGGNDSERRFGDLSKVAVTSRSRGWAPLPILLLARLLSVIVANAQNRMLANLPTLTHAEQITEMSMEEAGRGYPVRIRGVFAGLYDPSSVRVIGFQVLTASWSDVKVLERRPQGLWSVPARPIRWLLRLTPEGGFAHRVYLT